MTVTEFSHMPNVLLEGLHVCNDESTGNISSVLYIDIIGFSRFEQNYGTEACNFVICAFADSLHFALSKGLLRKPELKVIHVWDDAFAILFPYSASSNHPSTGDIHQLVLCTEERMNEKINVAGYSSLHLRYGLSSSSLQNRVNGSNEHTYHLITQAGRIARRNSGLLPLYIVEEIENIIHNQTVRMHYQPIWHLKTQNIIGWECLARGPRHSIFESPATLFDYAERTGHLLEMERICRNQGIHHAKIGSNRRLFINISPKILSDPLFRTGETLSIIEQAGLSPEQIVFEITEHHAIAEYPAFLQLVNHYRKQGYRIAIDDVGAGHSGLVTLMQVKPDFVKIDMELIRQIEKDKTKQDIVRAIYQISTGFFAEVIAEGIETSDELACLMACGIEVGQGFLLGKPGLQTNETESPSTLKMEPKNFFL